MGSDFEEENQWKPLYRVAVIGGGIGGTTAALFLREEFLDEVEIDLYEKDKIGGRLAIAEIGGRFYESGEKWDESGTYVGVQMKTKFDF